MNPSTTLRTLVLVPFACVALYGCPNETESTADLGSYADVLIEGEATDEGLVALGEALDEGPPAEDPTQAPFLDEPGAGELPKSPIPTFKWSFGEASSRLEGAPLRIFAAGGIHWPRPAHANATMELSLAPVTSLFGPPRAARAHGNLNGPATFLVFSTASEAKLLRVFTDATSYTPSQDAWDQLAAAGEEITLTLIGAVFEGNRIAEGGGPFQGGVSKFTVAK